MMAKTLQLAAMHEYIFHHVVESLQLLHKNCSVLHAINCAYNHGVRETDTEQRHIITALEKRGAR